MTEEIKHLVSERLEGFTPGDYKDGDSVIYRPKDSTEWATVTLGHVPAGSKLVERIGNTIRLYTGAPPSSYVESTFTPKKIEYNVGDTVNHAGVDYDVTNLKVNPVGGKIEYDLQISTPSPGFPAEVKGVTLEAINTLKTLDSLETSFQTEQTNIFDEVKKIQGEEKIKLFNELTRLSTMVAEMRSTLGSIETWSNLQAVDFERIEEKIKILNDTLKQAVKDLNAEIKIVLSTESTQQLSIDKKKAGEGILLKYKKELAKKDRAIKPLLRE